MEMPNELYEGITKGFAQFMAGIYWGYFFLFMFISYMVLVVLKSKRVFPNIQAEMGKTVLVFLIGILTGIFYIWAYELYDRVEVIQMFETLVFTTFVTKFFGINKLVYKLTGVNK
jgi:glucan phosphoethanolaminetransferase (alkaline phosphatase superfamily)